MNHPALYPRCNGQPAPSPADSSGDAAARRRFLDAYHEINRCSQELQRVRAGRAVKAEERAALQAIERALVARDALEDEYAPRGLIATPVFENGLVTDVRFGEPPRPRAPSSLSMLFAVPLPPKE